MRSLLEKWGLLKFPDPNTRWFWDDFGVTRVTQILGPQMIWELLAAARAQDATGYPLGGSDKTCMGWFGEIWVGQVNKQSSFNIYWMYRCKNLNLLIAFSPKTSIIQFFFVIFVHSCDNTTTEGCSCWKQREISNNLPGLWHGIFGASERRLGHRTWQRELHWFKRWTRLLRNNWNHSSWNSCFTGTQVLPGGLR